MMTSHDVLSILDLLHDAGVTVWLDGGWGVDALLGEQTRPHRDLDIAIRHDDVAAFMQVMVGAGLRPVDGGTPLNFIVADGRGREVDVHLVDIDVVTTNEDGNEIHGPAGLPYVVGSLGGTGTILGRQVACCTTEFRLQCYSEYEVTETDFQDATALCARFDLPLPPPFIGGSPLP